MAKQKQVSSKTWKQYAGFAGLVVLFLVAAAVVAGILLRTHDSTSGLAAAYFTMATTTSDLRNDFKAVIEREKKNNDAIHIAIMPGHEPGYGGAHYKDLKERDMNIVLSEYLTSFLDSDDAFEVTLLRDEVAWLPELETYFETHKKEIDTYISKQKALTHDLLLKDELSFDDSADVFHGDAPSDIAYRLYAINHWLSYETDVDMVIHVHYNDTASRNIRAQDPSGMAIYVPHSHYTNHEPSVRAAEYIYKRLQPWHVPSNHRQEIDGVVPNHKLIALGTKNTLTVAALLIEYGYIYEYRYQDPEVFREIAFDQALQTYWGIRDFFEDTDVSSDVLQKQSGLFARIPEELLPLRQDIPQQPAVVSLQALLRSADTYPVGNDTLRECPIDGLYGPCTTKAVKAFQSTHDITVDGVAGEDTIDRLYEKPKDEYREFLSE